MTQLPPSQSTNASRVLAALDGNPGPGSDDSLDLAEPSETFVNALKRKLPTTVNEVIVGSSKRRALLDTQRFGSYTPQSAVGSSTSTGTQLPSAMNNLSVSPRKSTGPLTAAFHLRYDHETPLRKIDFGGEDQHEKLAEFVTKPIENWCNGLSVSDAMERLGLSSKRDLIPGLEVRLLPHQLIGVSWMVDQEKSGPHKGGILADEMGLGKTVQMIAVMAANQPDPDDACRTTLIVVPAALLQQWKEEIDSKTNGIFRTHIYHGRDKLKTASAIKARDVIITTYPTLGYECTTPEDIEMEEEEAWLARNGGLLVRMKWYRVILDEAHFIRNRSTRSSRSVAMLRARYRWMLSGTPVTNTLADIYGLIRFGHFRPWNDWNSFNEYIAKIQLGDANLAGMRAQEILKPLLLRRTKDSTIEGEPILQLPPKDIEIVQLEFSPEERQIYDQFEKRATIQINRYIKQNNIVKNNVAVLAMLLRLRQLCCHPNLILSQTEEFEDPSLFIASDAEKEIGRAKQAMGAAWVAQIRQKYMARAVSERIWNFTDESDHPEASCPVCHDFFMQDTGRILACGHEICFECLLTLSSSAPVHDGIFGYGTEEENARAEKQWEAAAAQGLRPCPTCKKMNDLSSGKVFKCSAFEPSEDEVSEAVRARRQERRHKPPPMKRVETVGVETTDEDSDIESSTLSPIKPLKRKYSIDELSDDDLPDIGQLLAARRSSPKKEKKSRRLVVSDTEEEEDEMHDITPSRKAVNKSALPKKNAKERGKQKNTGGDGDGPSEAALETWKKGDDNLEPSAKMMALVRLLKSWHVTGDKTICFSQWTSMLDLVEKVFARYGIRSLRYDGRMDKQARDSALATFRTPGGPKVILISIKAGGIGLNLVAANRIINLDLSWNWAAEAQAYDRVHRLGQEKSVYVKRLVVKNTVEERMLQLQDIKLGLAEAALGEGSGTRLHKLSVKEIKLLFGMGKNNQQGQPANGQQQPEASE